jgi:AraC-like DNA-binding protein
MQAHAEAVITVPDLCAAAHTSRRALQYAFEDLLQLSPISYLRCMRLNRVRRDLLRQPAAAVGDVAARWGFWHLSRLRPTTGPCSASCPRPRAALRGHPQSIGYPSPRSRLTTRSRSAATSAGRLAQRAHLGLGVGRRGRRQAGARDAAEQPVHQLGHLAVIERRVHHAGHLHDQGAALGQAQKMPSTRSWPGCRAAACRCRLPGGNPCRSAGN